MEIYAEISKKVLGLIESGGKFSLPDGVVLRRKGGSRSCYFECQDKESKKTLIELLEAGGICWQEND